MSCVSGVIAYGVGGGVSLALLALVVDHASIWRRSGLPTPNRVAPTVCAPYVGTGSWEVVVHHVDGAFVTVEC